MFGRGSVLLAGTCLGVLAVAGAVLVLSARGEKGEGEIPAVKKVTSQNQAVRQARAVDLPLLEKADKVVIEGACVARGRRVTIDKVDDLKELRQTLQAQALTPSAGITAATLAFYHGDTLLRKIWVYGDGEWGFERPGTSWTTGSEANLWNLVKKHLKV